MNEFSLMIKDYMVKDYDSLSKNLDNIDNRIKFEKWLLQNFSPDAASSSEVAWQCRVLSLICTKIGKDSTASVDSQKKEDVHLADLISKTDASITENQKITDKLSDLFKLQFPSSSEHVLDLAQIHAQIHAANLPVTCLALLKKMQKYPDFNFKMIFTQAINHKNFSMVKTLAEEMPDEFKVELEALAYKPNSNLEKLKFIVPAAPDVYKTYLTNENSYGELPVAWAVLNHELKVIEFIAEIAPDTLKVKNDAGHTPFFLAVMENDLEKARVIAKAAPDTLIENSEDAGKLLSTATKNNNYKMFQLLLEASPASFQEPLIKQKEDIARLFLKAVKDNNAEMVKFILKAAPDTFKTDDKMQKQFNIAFNLAVQKNYLEMVKCMFEAAEEQSKKSMVVMDDIYTPLHIALENNNLEMLRFFLETAPEEFKRASLITKKYTNLDDTPLSQALKKNNFELMKFLIKVNPDAVNVLRHDGKSFITILKSKRPENYHEMLKLIKNNLELTQHYKEYIYRSALGHAWHIGGTSSLIKEGSGARLVSMNLEGHFANEWFHLMNKDFDGLKEHYPDLFGKDQSALLKHLFDSGANENFYTTKERVERIQAGLPVVLNTGFAGHVVNVLIWGDQFVLCNRGGEKRKSIEVYHFNPANMDEETIEKISAASAENASNYRELFFTILPNKLAFFQNELDHLMEAAHSLPDQIVGNCSFVSAITSIYAFMLLGNVRGIDEQGCFVNQEPGSKQQLEEGIKKTVAGYQTWLSHLQISFLERSIRYLTESDNAYIPDHQLIKTVLRTAHLLPLDALGQARLNQLTTKYIGSLEPAAQSQMETDLIFWKTLSKQPLYS
jgi:ankyrin repeat protein